MSVWTTRSCSPRVHTQFNGHPSEVHTVLLTELDQPEKQALLRRLWTDPESFRPGRTSRDGQRLVAHPADVVRLCGQHSGHGAGEFLEWAAAVGSGSRQWQFAVAVNSSSLQS